jgi:hypothetical protein
MRPLRCEFSAAMAAILTFEPFADFYCGGAPACVFGDLI